MAFTADQSSDKDIAVGQTASDLETALAENVTPIQEEELSLTSAVDSWDAVQEREGWGDGRDSHESSLLNSNLGMFPKLSLVKCSQSDGLHPNVIIEYNTFVV